MIRSVTQQDAASIAKIYNEYVLNSTITFETEPVTVAEMEKRINRLSKDFPYFVYEEINEIQGYCYLYYWTETAAYKYNLENSVYLS